MREVPITCADAAGHERLNKASKALRAKIANATTAVELRALCVSLANRIDEVERTSLAQRGHRLALTRNLHVMRLSRSRWMTAARQLAFAIADNSEEQHAGAIAMRHDPEEIPW